LTPDDLTALSDGVSGPFWSLFKQHAETEWGRSGERFHAAVMKAATKNEADGHAYLQMVLFAQTEIAKLLQWPEEMAKQARQQEQRPVQVMPGSRRGPGL
jgi:hypothetical protein